MFLHEVKSCKGVTVFEHVFNTLLHVPIVFYYRYLNNLNPIDRWCPSAELNLLIRLVISHLIGRWELLSCTPMWPWIWSTLTGLQLLSVMTRPHYCL